MLAFLRHAGGSSSLPKDTAAESNSVSSKDRAIYFDIMVRQGSLINSFLACVATLTYLHCLSCAASFNLLSN